MKSCSVVKNIEIVRGGLCDYEKLAGFHYRDSRLGPFKAIFALRVAGSLAWQSGAETVGVIVYTMPSIGLELRNVATGGVFVGLDRASRLALINKNIRCIGRVIIEPRFRGLGLASRLVRETMAQMEVPIVESAAVMGLVNPFFEKAGMQAFTAPLPARCVQLTQAFSMVGIEDSQLPDSRAVQRKIDRLPSGQVGFIEVQIRCFLQSYGKRRSMAAGLERTRFVLSKLTARPVYYIWFNPKMVKRLDGETVGR